MTMDITYHSIVSAVATLVKDFKIGLRTFLNIDCVSNFIIVHSLNPLIKRAVFKESV